MIRIEELPEVNASLIAIMGSRRQMEEADVADFPLPNALSI